MTRDTFYRTLNARAMQNGLIMGGVWIAAMLCFCHSFVAPVCNSLFVALAVFSPFIIGYMTRRFQLQQMAGERKVMGRLYLYALLIYCYGSVLLAVGVAVYFLYFDGGMFFNSYLDFLNRPDVSRMLSASLSSGGMSVDSLADMIRQMSRMKVSVYVFSTFYMNVVCGIFVSIPIALVCFIIKR